MDNTVDAAPAADKRRIVKELALFFGMTFGIMYGIGLIGMVFRDRVESLFGPISNTNLFVMVLIYGPTISAAVLTGAREGRAGFKALFARAVSAPSALWWLVSAAFLPALYGAMGLASLALGTAAVPFGAAAFWGAFPPLVFSLNILADYGPLGEELGWRGYALPRLLKLLPPVPAAAVLGVAWTLFHVVSFLAPGTAQSSMNFVWFALACCGMCFLMTWLHLRSGGNWIISGVVPHYVFNTFSSRGALPIGPALAAMLWIPVVVLLFMGEFGNKRRDAAAGKAAAEGSAA